MSKAAIKRKAFLAKVDKSKLVPDSEKVQLSWKNLLYQVPAVRIHPLSSFTFSFSHIL